MRGRSTFGLLRRSLGMFGGEFVDSVARRILPPATFGPSHADPPSAASVRGRSRCARSWFGSLGARFVGFGAEKRTRSLDCRFSVARNLIL